MTRWLVVGRDEMRGVASLNVHGDTEEYKSPMPNPADLPRVTLATGLGVCRDAKGCTCLFRGQSHTDAHATLARRAWPDEEICVMSVATDAHDM